MCVPLKAMRIAEHHEEALRVVDGHPHIKPNLRKKGVTNEREFLVFTLLPVSVPDASNTEQTPSSEREAAYECH